MQSCSCASRSWACAWYVSGIGEEQKLENWFLGRVDSSLLLYSVHAYVSQVKVKTDTASIMLIEADYKNENSWAERTDWGKSAEICLMHFRWNWWNRLEWTLPSLWLWLPCRCELFWLRSAHNLFCAMTIRTKGVGCEGRQTTCESLHEKPSFNIHHMRLPDSGDHSGRHRNKTKRKQNATQCFTYAYTVLVTINHQLKLAQCQVDATVETWTMWTFYILRQEDTLDTAAGFSVFWRLDTKSQRNTLFCARTMPNRW